MSKIILAINAGSSSVKVSVFSASKSGTPKQLAETQIDGLTAPPPKFKYTRGDTKVEKDKELSEDIKDQESAFKYILDQLIHDKELHEINNKDDIGFACHRVVHGGDFETAKVIDRDTYHHLEALTDLAPLHNASALAIIKACHELLPTSKNVAYFDSQFHHTLPEFVRTYPIDQEIAKKNKLRKYGFHGISYSFITRSTAEFLRKAPGDVNLIALHLGSGASACAVKNGQSWDTSMGLTPLAGLPGATRSGSIDPSLVFHYASNVGKLSPSSTGDLHISTAEEILNKQAGWKSLTGTTDFGKIASSKDKACVLAFDILVDRISSYVGQYFVSLEGRVDALVFAGGIGEKSGELRKRVVERCACLGFAIDPASNDAEIKYVVQAVGAKGKSPQVLVCQTDEQFEMARGVCKDEQLW